MNSYQCTLLLSAPASDVYAALTTQRGIQSWWTASSVVGTSVGETITLRFGQTFKVMRIEALDPDTQVRWQVIDAQLVVPGLTRTNEWIGTRIDFHLDRPSDSVTRLTLEHVGLTPEIECYELCSQGWSQFLASLKRYVETGTGTPFVEPAA